MIWRLSLLAFTTPLVNHVLRASLDGLVGVGAPARVLLLLKVPVFPLVIVKAVAELFTIFRLLPRNMLLALFLISVSQWSTFYFATLLSVGLLVLMTLIRMLLIRHMLTLPLVIVGHVRYRIFVTTPYLICIPQILIPVKHFVIPVVIIIILFISAIILIEPYFL